jgi:chromosome segregation ATPase
MSEQVRRVCTNTLTGLIDLAHEQRHTLVNQNFSDNDEGDAFSRVRDSRIARIDRIIEAASAAPDDDYDALHAEAEALRADIATIRADRDAFGQNAVDMRQRIEALRAENGRLRDSTGRIDAYWQSELRDCRNERDQLRTELEAARGLLREVGGWIDSTSFRGADAVDLAEVKP